MDVIMILPAGLSPELIGHVYSLVILLPRNPAADVAVHLYSDRDGCICRGNTLRSTFWFVRKQIRQISWPSCVSFIQQKLQSIKMTHWWERERFGSEANLTQRLNSVITTSCDRRTRHFVPNTWTWIGSFNMLDILFNQSLPKLSLKSRKGAGLKYFITSQASRKLNCKWAAQLAEPLHLRAWQFLLHTVHQLYIFK